MRPSPPVSLPIFALLAGLLFPGENTLAQSPESFGVTTDTLPVLNTDPDPRYWPRLRMWQGIPGIECSQGGRLWATWYAGPLAEGSPGNYAVLVTSGDGGQTWSRPVAVFDPTPFFGGNTADPHLWIDPSGRLWWFVNRNLRLKDPNGIRSMWGFSAGNPDDEELEWAEPVLAGYGVGLNKPTVLSNGDWLRPADNFNSKDPKRTQFYLSEDKGKQYRFLTDVAIDEVVFSEHMVVERKDKSLLMLARATYGIAKAESHDMGRSWTNQGVYLEGQSVNTRFFFRRLRSGELLLVVNDHPRARTNLTAMLSEDEGKTWPHRLLLDDRSGVSYPDGAESAEGHLYVTYDRGRYTKDEQEILFARITGDDIKAGEIVDPESRLRQLINRLADHGGGVHETREPILLEEEFEGGR